ncbi:MAG: gamma-glutamyltransferase [Bryobacteraceae bacterium]
MGGSDGAYLALGSPGSGRIISSVLQIILNGIDHRMPLPEAVAYPRFHHSWLPDRLYVEPGFPAATLRKLESMRHAIEQTRVIGEVHAVWLNGEWLEGVADARGDGAAAGF